MSNKKIVCVDQFNNRITFSYDFPFFIKQLDGFHKVTGTVSSSKNAFSIGEKYNGTSVPKRNIVISGMIKDNFVKNREFLYKIFSLKKEGTLYYYEDDISRKINYQVEDIDVDDAGVPRNFSISLLCMNPYFTDTEETIITMSNWIAAFEFPFAISKEEGFEFGYKNMSTLSNVENDTNISIGMNIKFTIADTVKNPTLINMNTQEKMIIENEFIAGDTISITTYINNKNIILTRNGESKNINNFLKFGTKFLEIHPGSNTFRATADVGAENLTTEIKYLTNYEAV